MKRKFTWITALSVLLALFVGLGIFAACDKGGGSEAKPSEYVDGVNCYYGDGNDVHIQGWYGSLSDSLFTVEEADDGSTHMHYYGDAAWRDFRFSIDGEYSDFSWLNITMKRGETAVVAFVKIVNPIREEYDNPNVLGADVYFDLTEEYVTYSFQIPSVSRQIMDIADIVCLFPDPGTTGTYGDIYVKDAWFSKEQPEGSTWMNNTDTSNDAGWTAESWTGYSIRSAEDAELRLSFSNPAEWAGAFRPIDLADATDVPEGKLPNKLTFVFSSDAYNGAEDTVDNIVFAFRGDEASWNDGGWWNYYEQRLYVYNKGDVAADSDGNITLEIPIGAALEAMAGQYEKQLLLGLNIESCPEYSNYDGKGQMTIKSVTLSYEEGFEAPEPELPAELDWGVVESGEAYYRITERDGVTNVAYENVPNTLWANLYANVPSGTAATVELQLRNNGENTVTYRLDCGSTEGAVGTIEPGETKTVKTVPNGAYNVINFFVDGGVAGTASETYSGDLDILSFAFSSESSGSGLSWSGTGYTVAEKDGTVNVTYANMNPTGWTPLAAEVPSDLAANSTVTVQVRNNGTETVKYKYSLDKSGAAVAEVFGTIAGGATETLTLTAEGGYTTICLFFDCCYDPAADTGIKESYSGDLDILSVTFSGGAAEPGPGEGTPVSVTWVTSDPAFGIVPGEDGTAVNYTGVNGWQNINFDIALSGGQTSISLTLKNNSDHTVKLKLNAQTQDWSAQIGADSDPACAWAEVEAGATQTLTLIFTAEQAAQVAHVLLMVDCWDDGTAYSGSLLLQSVTVA